MSFRLSLRHRRRAADSALCVGLDPDPTRIPRRFGQDADAIARFCREIVDATADQVCAFKPQIAYFAAASAEPVLERLIDYIHERHPGIPVILDAKRGDIGQTARQYATEAFERYRADALTVSPFMGFDSIEPYLEHEGRGVLLLCRTSNPGGADLQQLATDGEALYERIARLAAGPWNRSGELGLVVGATVPQELRRVRAIAPDLPILVPGIGAQGGDIEATVAAGIDHEGGGLIINSSRAILFAGEDPEDARTASIAARDAIRAATAHARTIRAATARAPIDAQEAPRR